MFLKTDVATGFNYYFVSFNLNDNSNFSWALFLELSGAMGYARISDFDGEYAAYCFETEELDIIYAYWT